jgi:hypothetical protein
MKRLQRLIDDLNRQLFNLAGLNMLWPRKVGFLFVSRSRPFERLIYIDSITKAGDRILCELAPPLLPWTSLTAGNCSDRRLFFFLSTHFIFPYFMSIGLSSYYQHYNVLLCHVFGRRCYMQKFWRMGR